MAIVTTIDVSVNERAFLIENGVPVRFLPQGRTRVFAVARSIDVQRFPLTAMVADLTPEHLALVDDSVVQRVEIAEGERGVIVKKGRPVSVLVPGVHFVWRRADVRVDVVDTSSVTAEPLAAEYKRVFADKGYVETTVAEGGVALRFVDGQIDAVLPPGKHAAWSTTKTVLFTTIDLRERQLAINGQEVMTKDKVTVRLNATVGFEVRDPKRIVTSSKDAEATLYVAAQLAFRDAIATHTLDALLADRVVLAERVQESLVEKARSLGLAVVSVGVKDLVLPGEMKTLLNRVIEAQKEAEANVISRREETAATRSLLQTAKVLEENPMLLRLKELETYKELAAKVGTLHVVMGEQTLQKVDLKV